MLRREDILGAVDIKIEELQIPEWGGAVYVRAMTGTEREAYDDVIYRKKTHLLATLAQYTIVDKDGARVFSPEDIPALAAKSSYALERIWDWHKAHSGVGAKALEESQKNLEAGLNGATSSVSPSASGG
jgi:hypothetical protein